MSPARARHDDDVVDGQAIRPDETTTERYDRNWNESLQELRVLQTGSQIITGFLLALAFQPSFVDLTPGQRTFYLVLVVLAALSAIFALTPVALHRMVFRRQAKREVVAYGHAGLIATLMAVSLLLVGVVAFIFDVVVSDAASWIAGTALGIVMVALWLVLPAIVRVRRRLSSAPTDRTTA